MTDVSASPPLVRPAFLKVSALVFVLTLAFAVRAVWDYVENRRFDKAVHEIQLKGEPTQSPATIPAWDTDEASRDYRAAGALASNFHGDARLPLRTLVASMQKDEWPEGSVESLRATLAPYDEAMSLADRAAALSFDEFQAGTYYNYRTSDFLAVQEICGYRAIFRALNQDADGAVDSLYTEARQARAMGSWSLWQRLPRPLIVAQVLERVRPSSAALGRLSKAMSDLDDDRELSRWFEEIRRSKLTTGWRNVELGAQNSWETPVLTVLGLRHPAAMHVMNRMVAVLTAIVDASHGPWPARIDAVSAIDDPYLWRVPSGQSQESYTKHFATDIASTAAGFRAVRIVVAVEQYRRDHGEQLPPGLGELVPVYFQELPIDPFSGESLLFKREQGGYSIYSVGVNRKDDGGAEVNLPFIGAFPKEHPADIGVRVRYQQRETK
jgi:hypothetical protein